MSEELLNRLRHRTADKVTTTQYTAKDFQLEVLGKLAELQSTSEEMEKNWREELKGVKEQRPIKFDSRTLVALGALALSITGYVIQDARNTARQDNEIETTKGRVVRLEQIAATNTEGRIRTEEELTKLREGQAEIKAMIQAHDARSGDAMQKSSKANGGGGD